MKLRSTCINGRSSTADGKYFFPFLLHNNVAHKHFYRLSLDAAYNKLEKLKSSKSANTKKDREVKDAEEEYEEAKSR